MRKRLITPTPENIRTRGEGWLDVERAAVAEVTSEDKDFPVEAAFVSGDARGWRASAPRSQTIRLIFDQPQTFRCISLVFEEKRPSARKSSLCGGLRMVGNRSKELCVSNGISVHLGRSAKSRNTKWSCRTLLYLNWSSSRISAGDSLARR